MTSRPHGVFASEDAEGIGSYLPGFTVNHVNGAQPISERDEAMKEFSAVERGLVTNARCLTEGIDVLSVDMVAFMSPRKSKVDIVQAVGRAMRKAGKEKTHGYVLVPLFLEQRKGESIKSAFERSDFEEVADVLNAMREHDDDLAEIIRELRQQKGETGGVNETRLAEKVEVLGPEVELAELRSSIAARLIDAIGSNCDEMYGRLLAYKKKHGDCNVPQRYEADLQLGWWVASQRAAKKRGTLNKEQIERLRKLEFVWKVRLRRGKI